MTKAPSNRLPRLNELIQRKIAQLIQQELRDPRLGFITISGVEVAKDTSSARVYFTTLAEDTTKAQQILNKASPYLRVCLGRTLETRIVPQLHFIYDNSLENSRRIDELIQDNPPKTNDHD
ncbi:MAG: ribosome-binding factor A [Legionellales bacterium RIFCSPHIGHO2_12_FULL_37_14]|nr:MAG: ribosome-binding factor A [Legionellales bacterium RIFCSPHIGHO2_12_FULL_37_14]